MSLDWFYLKGFMAFTCYGAVGYGLRDTEKSVAAPGAGTGGDAIIHRTGNRP